MAPPPTRAGDLRSPAVIVFKGVLFLMAGLAASGILLMRIFSLSNLFLLVVAIWAFCRFYYFLFHVLEHYVGTHRYRGLWDMVTRRFKR